MKKKYILRICTIGILMSYFCCACEQEQQTQPENVTNDSVYEQEYQTDLEGKIIVPREEFIKLGASFNMKEISKQTTSNFCWTYQFENQDYDADGLYDDVYVTRTEDGTLYTIQFGNGDILDLGPFEGYDIGFYIESADLDLDGNKEILYLGTHITITRPYSEIILAKKENSEYSTIEMMKYSNTEENSEWRIGADFYVLDVNTDEGTITIGNDTWNIYNDFIIPQPKEYEKSIEEQLSYYKKAYKDKLNIGGYAWSAKFSKLEDNTVLEITIPIDMSCFADSSEQIIPYRNAVIKYIYEEETWTPIEINIVEEELEIWWN